MRKSFLLTSLILGVLLLTPPARALNYTGTAEIDWASLTFSGIPIDASNSFVHQQGSEFVLINAAGERIYEGGYSPGWRDEIKTFATPEVVTLTTTADPSRLFSSVNLINEGFGLARLDRRTDFQALETGPFTISVGYTLTHVGVPASQGAFSSDAIAGLVLGWSAPFPYLIAEQHLSALSGSGTQTGTLSLSRTYQGGEVGFFAVGSGVQTENPTAQSVPVPNMLWPTFAGMIGIALYTERRRRREQLS